MTPFIQPSRNASANFEAANLNHVDVNASVLIFCILFRIAILSVIKQISTMVSHLRPAILRLIIRLSRQGRTQQEIAEISGVSQESISKILKRALETEMPT